MDLGTPLGHEAFSLAGTRWDGFATDFAWRVSRSFVATNATWKAVSSWYDSYFSYGCVKVGLSENCEKKIDIWW